MIPQTPPGPAQDRAVPAIAAPPGRKGARKAEDTAGGCRRLAAADLERAASSASEQMRAVIEHSATVWSARADLLDRLEAASLARAARIRSSLATGR